MKRTGKKVLAFLLSLTLAISMMSISVFAEDADEIADGNTYDSVEEYDLVDEYAPTDEYDLADEDVPDDEDIPMDEDILTDEDAPTDEDELTDEDIPADEDVPADEDDTSDEVEWIELSEAGSLSSGNYYLSEDLSISGGVSISEGAEVTIDLNGHVLRRTGLRSAEALGYVISNNGTLTIQDSSGDNSGRITGGYAYMGGGVLNYGTLILNGGTISGNTVVMAGAGVYNVGEFSMYGGNIINNYLEGQGAAGVYNDGVFAMYGGVISGNSSTDPESAAFGGGVWNNGTFVIYDGEISANRAGAGGGVSNQGDFAFIGGTINGNRANYMGGGVYNTGTMTMASGEISENYATDGGGGIVNQGELFISGGRIIDNSTADYGFGGGIEPAGDCYLYLSGAPVISGNKSGETASNVFLAESDGYPSGAYIYLESELTEGASIGVTTLVAPSEENPVQISAAENDTNYYISSAKYIVSDVGYSVRSNTDGGYIELYVGSGENAASNVSTGDGGETEYASAATSPKTADSAPIFAVTLLALCAGAAYVILVARKKRV